ncbi:uncharacterized protein LOC132559629 [Ylistrum balloti]|uniref:uncharacterized protein LOC132559629 n=1 Tax=Ylistrum balloti TaxID=509963 RepID=UPI002905F68C|nr:uncharacterized protein LOC132559629 [Ylistrum balloti]
MRRVPLNYIMEKPVEGVKTIVNLIKSTNEASVLKDGIAKFSKAAIEWYVDSEDLDILHHAIICNNIEAVGLFFHQGYFKLPHESPSVPYLHLSARLGHKTILAMLIQERGHDNVPMKFKYYGQTGLSEDSPKAMRIPIVDGKDKLSPLDIAGEYGHIGCVCTILDHFYGGKVRHKSKSTKDAYVNLACELDSPPALRLLLSHNPTEEDIKNAVGVALKMARPECLDVLLGLKPDISSLFGGMNLYHVLFSYSLSFKKSWYESLLTVTTLLIKHSHDLSKCLPYRTYPLYSLLSHSSCHDLDNSSPYLLACLLVMLNAGADPNFDELEFEKELTKRKFNSTAAFGRSAFSSAIHCLFDTIGKYSDQVQIEQKLSLRSHLGKCTEALLKHGADLNYVGRIEDQCNTYGNSLHCFCRIAPKIGLGWKMLKLLLRHGANPDAKIYGYYPLNVFFEHLLAYATTSDRSHVFGIEHSSFVMDSMAQSALRDSYEIFSNMAASFDQPSSKHKRILAGIKTEYEKRISDVWTLRRWCVFTVWVSCGRKIDQAARLPLPKRLRDSITDSLEYVV